MKAVRTLVLAHGWKLSAYVDSEDHLRLTVTHSDATGVVLLGTDEEDGAAFLDSFTTHGIEERYAVCMKAGGCDTSPGS